MRDSTAISIFVLVAAVLAAGAVATLVAHRSVRRRLRRPNVVFAATGAAAVVLVPANL